MKAFLTLFMIALAYVPLHAQGKWERLAVPVKCHLQSVFFTDSLYGWIAGDSGTIYHTTDGGNNWAKQDTHADNDVAEVFFLDRNRGWASTFNFTEPPFGTILLETTNGGADWESRSYPDENIFINCILFRDTLNGWMGGTPHALVKTTDGGITWEQAAIDTSTLAFFPVLSLQFYNDRYGYASGGMFDIAGVVWHTSDGGEKWYAIDQAEAPADEVHALYLFDSLHVMGAGGDPDFGYGVGMIRTSDGGMSWTYDELDIQGNAYDLDFRNDREAWAPLGARQKLIYSLDAGETWTAVLTPDSTAIYDMTFPDSLHGYAVGRYGAVLRYRPNLAPSVNPVPFPEDQIIVCRNSPNPFSSATKITYHVPSGGKFHNLISGMHADFFGIKVYDLPGNEIASLEAESGLSPGDHSIEFRAGDLSGGIYFYQMALVSAGKTYPLSPPGKFILLR